MQKFRTTVYIRDAHGQDTLDFSSNCDMEGADCQEHCNYMHDLCRNMGRRMEYKIEFTCSSGRQIKTNWYHFDGKHWVEKND